MNILKTSLIAGAVALAVSAAPAFADDSTNSKQQPIAAKSNATTQPMTGKEKATTIGAGTGAVAGAVVGGPVGAVIGAGVGAYVGHEGTDANGKVTNTKTARWNHDDVARAQTALNDKGYNVAVDGQFGPNTSAAVRSFQSDNGLAANGTLDDATLKALGVRG